MKAANKTLIGLFIVGAVVLAVIGTLALGGGSLLRESQRYVLYFSGSVKGLGLGAPVQLKGVTLGKVIGINLVYDYKKRSFLNRVALEVSEGSVIIANEPHNKKTKIDDTIDTLIDNGLRAKLQIQSFVTGQLLVAFDFYPDTPVNLTGIEDDLHELPTLPSDMEELARTFDTLDLQGMVESFKNTANGIDEFVNSVDFRELAGSANQVLKGYHRLAVNLDRQVTHLSTDLSATLSDVRHLIDTADGQITPVAEGVADTAATIQKTVSHLDDRLRPVMSDIEAAAVAARDALEQANATMTNLTHLTREDSPLVYQFGDALAEMQRAARALTVLADYLSRHPEALLRGKNMAKERK
jgi:paraquat-inducible protein B